METQHTGEYPTSCLDTAVWLRIRGFERIRKEKSGRWDVWIFADPDNTAEAVVEKFPDSELARGLHLRTLMIQETKSARHRSRKKR